MLQWATDYYSARSHPGIVRRPTPDLKPRTPHTFISCLPEQPPHLAIREGESPLGWTLATSGARSGEAYGLSYTPNERRSGGPAVGETRQRPR